MRLIFIFTFLLSSFRCQATLIRSTKERILESCVCCWTPWDYDSSNTRYFNLGRSLRGYDLVLNEPSASVLRPTRLTGNGYLWLPGLSHSLVIGTSTNAPVIGDIDIRAKAALNNWTAASLVTKSGGISPKIGFEFGCASSKLRMAYSTNGTAYIPTILSSVTHGISPGATAICRATVAQFSDKMVTTFYTGSDINYGPWTQLGASITNAGYLTNWFNPTNCINIGGYANGGDSTGYFYSFQIRSNINGAVVSSFDSTLCTQTGYTDTNSVITNQWIVNYSGGTIVNPIMRDGSSPSEWVAYAPITPITNFLFCTNSSLSHFSGNTTTNNSMFVLVRHHGTPGSSYLLSTRSNVANSAGFAMRYNSARQGILFSADGTNTASGAGGTTPFTDNAMAILATTFYGGAIATNWIDGVNGPTAVSVQLGSADTNSWFLFDSADQGNQTPQTEIYGAGICNYRLSAKDQKRLKWELASRGNMNAGTLAYNPGFSLFSWPSATDVKGPYPLVSVSQNTTVLTPPATPAISESDLLTHQYRHHTRISAFGGLIFLAFSSAGTNEADGGMQCAMCISTNKGTNWSAPISVVPSQSQFTNLYFLAGSRISYPRDFEIYNGTNYLVCAVDDIESSGGLYYGSALLAVACYTNGTIGPLLRISSATYPVVDGKSVASYDSTFGPGLMALSKVYGCWGGSSVNSAQSEWIGWWYSGSILLDEPNTFSVDGSTTNLYRIARASSSVMQSHSIDSGATWSASFGTSVPNAPSETTGLRLSTGQFVIIGNPVSGSTLRDPLYLAITASNSTTITNVYAIRQGLSQVPTYPGFGKQGGAAYPSVCQNGNYLYVGYSMQKESIGFSRVLIPGLPDNNNDQ